MRADTQQIFTITIFDGPPQTNTRDDVKNMAFHEFASLTAVSILAVSLQQNTPGACWQSRP